MPVPASAGKEETMKKMTIRVPKEWHRRLKIAAAEEGKTITEMLIAAVDMYVPDIPVYRRTNPRR